MQYERNDMNLTQGQVPGERRHHRDPPAYDETAVRVELFGDEVDRITVVDPLTGERLRQIWTTWWCSPPPTTPPAPSGCRPRSGASRWSWRSGWPISRAEGKLLEAQRLQMRTSYDLEMMSPSSATATASRTTRRPSTAGVTGEPPYTLLDYFPDDFLMVIDESHVAVPQLHGQYEGDRSRKETLIDHGFRLPSAADNRPLRFDEVMSRLNQVVFMSATPGDYELQAPTRWWSRSCGPPDWSTRRWW